ncbi:RNA-directed DNA polymerase, eukaryota, partial [Tanacetum coccineum]
VMRLLSTTSSILINGSPTREFNIHRGLRQGDPLSPFLFILATEGLHVAVEDAMAAGLYRGFKVNTLNHSHFFFADDALFIGDYSRANIKSLDSILECFHRVSGLKINFQKSNFFGVGVSFEEVELFASITGCNTLESPFSYLGLPIDCNMALVKSWDPIIDKFSKRLSKWKASLLSIGGRSTLIFSVLGAIGGLGIGSLYSLNHALIQKWRWWFRNNPQPLWARLIVSIHGISEDVSSFFSHVRNQGVWGRIVVTSLFNNNMIRDCWNNGWRLDWSHHISSGTNANHLASLYNQLSDFSLNNSEDTWIWSFGTSTFSVKSTREHIDHCSLPNGGFETRWNRLLPKKINIFIWRVLRDRLPSRWNLSRKGVDVVSLSCLVCDCGSETIHHSLWFCSLATTVWNRVLVWLDLPSPNFANIQDLYSWLDDLHISSNRRATLKVICGVVLWSLWNFRNETIFGTVPPKRSFLFDKIVDCSFRCLRGGDGGVWRGEWSSLVTESGEGDGWEEEVRFSCGIVADVVVSVQKSGPYLFRVHKRERLVSTESGVADVGMPVEVGCVKCHCNGVVVSGVPAKVGAIKCVDRVAGVIRNTGLELSYLYGHGQQKNFSAPYIVKELYQFPS